jgi:hypothetical protein
MRDTPKKAAGGISNLLLIRPEERGPVLYFVAFFVLVGAGMALGRGTTDALFIKRYGVQYLPVMYMILGAPLVPGSRCLGGGAVPALQPANEPGVRGGAHR